MWVQFAMFIGALLIGYYSASRAKPQKPQSADNIQTPSTEIGRNIPVVFGVVDLESPHIGWTGDMRIDPIRKKGGKK